MTPAADRSRDDVRVTLADLPSRPELEAAWRSLEERADGSIFTSWLWIGCWLDLLPGHLAPVLLRAEADGRTVGLGVLVANRHRRHGVFLSRGLFLHGTGEQALDELTVEYNGFLCERGWESLVTEAAITHLLRERSDWDELVVDGASSAAFAGLALTGRVKTRVTRRSTPYVVDLEVVRVAGGGEYLELLGPKTRKKIRRSWRHLEEFGPLSLEEAATVDQALETLGTLERLHQAHWRARGKGGSFSEPFFGRFHRRLIGAGQPAGGTQLLCLRVGQTIVGCIYNLVYRGHVYVYQSGFAYDAYPSASPGYVAHTLAIDRNAAAGRAIYDYMAGQEDYKQRMGQPAVELQWIVVQRDRTKFQVEDFLRSAYRRLKSAAGRAGEPAATRPSEEA